MIYIFLKIVHKNIANHTFIWHILLYTVHKKCLMRPKTIKDYCNVY